MSFYQTFQEIVSGRGRSVAHGAVRVLLHGLSWDYRVISGIRNQLFDRGLRSITSAGVPVISIGNITTGGTGKTPLVATVVRYLQQMNRQPGIVSRGYRSDASGINDEKRVLDRLCPGVPHIQNADRIAAAREAIDQNSADCLVLDDGFQHRRIARNLDIVVIDATNPFGHGYLLPRGLLRESPVALRRAGLVVVTRCDQVSDDNVRSIDRKVIRLAPGLQGKIVHVSFQATHTLDDEGNRQPLSDVSGRPVAVMTAIGNPAGFVGTCEQAGAHVVDTHFFPDHHHYSPVELRRVEQSARENGAQRVLTTLKDYVKVVPFDRPSAGKSVFEKIPLRAIEIATQLESPESKDILINELKTALTDRN